MPFYATHPEVSEVYKSAVKHIIGTLLAADTEVSQEVKNDLLQRMASCLGTSPIAVNTFIVQEAIAKHVQSQEPIPKVLHEMIKREAVEKMLLEEFKTEFDTNHPQYNYREKLAGLVMSIYPPYLGGSDNQQYYNNSNNNKLPSKTPDIDTAFELVTPSLVLKAAKKVCKSFVIDSSNGEAPKKLELDDAKVKEITEAYYLKNVFAPSLQAEPKTNRGVLERKGGETEPKQPYDFRKSLAKALLPLQLPQSPLGQAEAKNPPRGRQQSTGSPG